MSDRLYSIKDWDKNYENSRSRSVEKLDWVAIPNSHDSLGFAMVMAHPEAGNIFAAWVLILQVASRCQTRGVLARDNGKPHTATTLALQTRGKAEWFDLALELLCSEDIGWLCVTNVIESPDCHPAITRLSPDCQPTVTTRKGMEGNGIEGNKEKEAIASKKKTEDFDFETESDPQGKNQSTHEKPSRPKSSGSHIGAGAWPVVQAADGEFAVPEPVASDAGAAEAFREWFAKRVKAKSRPTIRSLKAASSWWGEESLQTLRAMLDDAADRGWTGLRQSYCDKHRREPEQAEKTWQQMTREEQLAICPPKDSWEVEQEVPAQPTSIEPTEAEIAETDALRSAAIARLRADELGLQVVGGSK